MLGADALVPPAQGSKDYLAHVLLSLAVFCMQASGGSAVHVRVSCKPAPTPLVVAGRACTHTLELQVAALGCVLSAEQQSDIFDPFSMHVQHTQPDAVRAKACVVPACVLSRCDDRLRSLRAGAGRRLGAPWLARVTPPGRRRDRQPALRACARSPRS